MGSEMNSTCFICRAYANFEKQVDEKRDLWNYRTIAQTLGKLNSHVRFIAVNVNMDNGVESVRAPIPIKENVRASSELFGIDPLFVANEGKLVAFVKSSDVEAALSAMRSLPEGRDAAVIGNAMDERKNIVLLRTQIGGTRIIELPFSELLPRIC